MTEDDRRREHEHLLRSPRTPSRQGWCCRQSGPYAGLARGHWPGGGVAVGREACAGPVNFDLLRRYARRTLSSRMAESRTSINPSRLHPAPSSPQSLLHGGTSHILVQGGELDLQRLRGSRGRSTRRRSRKCTPAWSPFPLLGRDTRLE